MKKVILTLTIIAMAFGNANLFAQKTSHETITSQILKHHFGNREEIIKPEKAVYKTHENGSAVEYTTSYTYDEYEYLLLEEYTEAGAMRKERKTYEYDFYGNVLSELEESSANGINWKNEALTTNTYEDEILLETVIQEWENNQWVNEEKMDYTYIENVTTVIIREWNGAIWSTAYLYTYTVNGNTMEVLKQYMQGGAWQNEEKDTYTLNFDGLPTNILKQEWSNNAWVNEERATYTYQNGLYTTVLWEEWENNGWVNEYKHTYQYENGNAIRGYSQEWENGQWVEGEGNSLQMTYNNNEEMFEYSAYEVVMTYTDLTDIEENAMNPFIIFPNPVNGFINISGQEVKHVTVYALNGQRVAESDGTRIDVSGLAAGVYMVKVEGNGTSQIQKVVVE